jgi:hypothetical protein
VNTSNIIVKKYNKYGVYNFDGKLILPINFEKIEFAIRNEKPVIVAIQKGKQYFYDSSGTEVK